MNSNRAVNIYRHDYSKGVIIIYGDEDQNDLMNMINNYKGEEVMEDNRIKEIASDIEKYKEAIENAEGALAEAERELDEELNRCYNK